METPIKISYRWSADEMLLLNRLHLKHSPQLSKARRSTRFGSVLFIAMGLVLFCGIGSTTEKWRLFAYGCGLIIIGTSLLAGPPVLMRRVVLRTYAKKPDKDMVVTYLVSEERILSQSEVASSDMLWRVIGRVHRTADGFLLYVSDNQIHWLPVRGFQDPADLDRFASLAKNKVESYKDER